MVDALLPARDALRGRGRRRSRPSATALRGWRTRPRRACGPRSRSSPARAGRATSASAAAGHQDPGATSTHLLLRSAAEACAGASPACRSTEYRRDAHGEVRRCPRPGHHEHPLHDLRPRRPGRGDRPEGARADLSRSRAGSSTTRWRSGRAPRTSSRARSTKAGITAERPRRGRASRTSARPTVVWDSNTGKPVYNAIVWQDTRTDRHRATSSRRTAARIASARRPACRSRPTSPARRCGGSSTTSTARAPRPRPGDLLFGNIDTWCIWNLTGGIDGGVHVTDVTNASRTMLMNLDDARLGRRAADGHRRAAVDAARDQGLVARSTARPRATLAGVPVAGDLGDQQAATLRPDLLLAPARRRTRTAPAASCS